MTNITKRLLALLLTFVLVISAYIPTYSATDYPTTYSQTANSGERDEVCTTLNGTSAGSYYTDGLYDVETLSKLSGDELYTALDNLMTKTHSHESSYNDCHYKADLTDCENGDKKVVLIYTGYSATMDQWNGWNREHVWPQSLGGNSLTPQVGEKKGGADLHHVRPSDAGVNSSRGNKPYGNVDNGTPKYGSNPATNVLGGHHNSTYFEPLDNVKGDIARIILYVYVRWGAEWGADDITEVFESVDVLLEWCALDPVDTWEMGRNEVVQAIQGNRNVFIDYPEYAWLLFNRDVPADMTTPSGEAQNGSFITCNHVNTAIKGVVIATCGSTGYTGDTYCVDCQKVTVKGQTVPVTSIHTFSGWVLNQSDNTNIRTCSICNKTETLVYNSPDELITYAESDAEVLLILMILGYNEKIFAEALSK